VVGQKRGQSQATPDARKTDRGGVVKKTDKKQTTREGQNSPAENSRRKGSSKRRGGVRVDGGRNGKQGAKMQGADRPDRGRREAQIRQARGPGDALKQAQRKTNTLPRENSETCLNEKKRHASSAARGRDGGVLEESKDIKRKNAGCLLGLSIGEGGPKLLFKKYPASPGQEILLRP